MRMPVGIVPQRLAANEDHPWFDPFWSRRASVYLGDQRMSGVVVADAVEGWIEFYPEPIRVEADRLFTIRTHGEVRIEIEQL